MVVVPFLARQVARFDATFVKLDIEGAEIDILRLRVHRIRLPGKMLSA